MSAPTGPVEAAPFWMGAAEGRLVLPHCDACDLLVWYPRDFCPRCLSRGLEWVEVTGRGIVYSSTLVERGGLRADGAAYVVAYVELEEGPRILAEIRGAAGAPPIGCPVRAGFETVDGESVLHFVAVSRT